MFDSLSIIFWSIVYILIALQFFIKKKSKKYTVPIPFPSIVFNLTWEFTALCTLHHWGHILWFSLDFVIAYLSYDFIKEKKNRLLYLFSIAGCAVVFKIIFNFDGGMLHSSFVIDIIMAFLFLIQVKQLSFNFRIPIAVAKLLGDLSALIYYKDYSIFVLIVGIIVLILNTAYLIISIYLIKKETPVKGKKKKKC